MYILVLVCTDKRLGPFITKETMTTKKRQGKSSKNARIFHSNKLKSHNFFILQSLDNSVASTMYKKAEIRMKNKEMRRF